MFIRMIVVVNMIQCQEITMKADSICVRMTVNSALIL